MNAPTLSDKERYSRDIPKGWRLLVVGERSKRGDYWWSNFKHEWFLALDGVVCSIHSNPVIRYMDTPNQVTIE